MSFPDLSGLVGTLNTLSQLQATLNPVSEQEKKMAEQKALKADALKGNYKYFGEVGLQDRLECLNFMEPNVFTMTMLMKCKPSVRRFCCLHPYVLQRTNLRPSYCSTVGRANFVTIMNQWLCRVGDAHNLERAIWSRLLRRCVRCNNHEWVFGRVGDAPNYKFFWRSDFK